MPASVPPRRALARGARGGRGERSAARRARYHPSVNLASLTTVDGAVVVAAGFFALRGAIKGFAWQFVRTLALLGGLYGAGLLCNEGEQWLERNADFVPGPFKAVIAWVAIALLIFFVLSYLASMARGLVRTAHLTGPDRVLGFLFGAVMGLTFATIGLVIWGGLKESDEDLAAAVRGSRALPYVVQVVDIVPILPRSTRERWRSVKELLDRESAQKS